VKHVVVTYWCFCRTNMITTAASNCTNCHCCCCYCYCYCRSCSNKVCQCACCKKMPGLRCTGGAYDAACKNASQLLCTTAAYTQHYNVQSTPVQHSLTTGKYLKRISQNSHEGSSSKKILQMKFFRESSSKKVPLLHF
jgi:hypothetical protein